MRHTTDPEWTRELMENYHASFGCEFPEGLALWMERCEGAWEDMPAVAFMLKTREPEPHELEWARAVIEKDRARIERIAQSPAN